MKDLIRFVKLDFLVQKVLLFLVCVNVVVFYLFPVPITLYALGIWQIFSTIVIRRKVDSEVRKNHLGFSIIQLTLMLSLYYYGKPERTSHYIFMLFIFIIIPVFLAIWYFIISKDTIRELKEEEILEMPETMNNILDSEEIFKPIEKIKKL